jgi:hypothetical protein
MRAVYYVMHGKALWCVRHEVPVVERVFDHGDLDKIRVARLDVHCSDMW